MSLTKQAVSIVEQEFSIYDIDLVKFWVHDTQENWTAVGWEGQYQIKWLKVLYASSE